MKEQTVEGKMQAGDISLNGCTEFYQNTNWNDTELTSMNWHGIECKIFLLNFSVNLCSKTLIILKF